MGLPLSVYLRRKLHFHDIRRPVDLLPFTLCTTLVRRDILILAMAELVGLIASVLTLAKVATGTIEAARWICHAREEFESLRASQALGLPHLACQPYSMLRKHHAYVRLL
jgi:hypothetical protein